jgi:hypothetical protein
VSLPGSIRHRQPLPLGACSEHQLKLFECNSVAQVDPPLRAIAKLIEYGPEALLVDLRPTLKNAVSPVALVGREEIIIVTHLPNSPGAEFSSRMAKAALGSGVARAGPRMDAAFCAAVEAAITAGLERPQDGKARAA